MEIKCAHTEVVDVTTLVPNYFDIQAKSKNPVRLQKEFAEILVLHKRQEFWVKVDFDDLKKTSKLRWKADQKTPKYFSVTSSRGKTTTNFARYLLGAPLGRFVDHINGDTTDNRRPNLRLCTMQENSWNRRSTKNRKWKGYYFCKERGKWVTQIHADGTTINIGRFMNEKEAAIAYNVAAKKHFGEFARLNEI